MHGGLSRVRYFQYGLSAPEGKYGNDGTGLGVAKVAVTQRDYCTEQERLTIGHLGERNLCRTHTWGATPVSNISFGNGNSVIYPLCEGTSDRRWSRNSYRLSFQCS